MRNALWILVAVTLALGTAACGGSGDTGDASGATTGAVEGSQHTGSAGGEAADAGQDQATAERAGDVDEGKTLFAATCAACHGPEAEGVEGLGKDMTTSAFIADLDDAGLIAFLKVGRGTDDPLNTTGVAMPPKGGNPALTDDQLADIVAYVRSLHK